VESAVIMAMGPVLCDTDIRVGRSETGNRNALVVPDGMTLAGLEREALLQALRRHDGNRQLTADELGISTRTIQRKIRDYDLPF
jgi:transcriptional regulator with PAS, ATPase and Fis domain